MPTPRPASSSAFWYYTRTVEGSEYAIYCRTPATGGPGTPPDVSGEIAGEQILLDANVEAEGEDFFSLGAFTGVPLRPAAGVRDRHLRRRAVHPAGHGPDHRRAAAGRDRRRRVRGGLGRRDAISSTPAPTPPGGRTWCSGTGWAPTPAADAEVLTEPDERFWIGVGSSRDEQWIVLGAGSKLTSEYRLLPTADPEGEPRLVAPRRQGVEYDVEPAGDRLLIVHNDGARTSSWPRRRWTPPATSSGSRCCRTRRASGSWACPPTHSHAVVSLRRDGLTGVHVLPRSAVR